VTSATTPAGAPGASLTARDRGAFGDRVFHWLALAAGLTVLAVLGLIAVTTTSEAWPALERARFDFVLSDRWVPNDVDGPGPLTAHFGALAYVFGTGVVATISLVLAVPVSLGIALFVTEVAPRRLRAWVVTLLDLLAAVPSVVFGLWGVLVLAPGITGFYGWLHDVLGWLPVVGGLFGADANGRSFMTAGIVLALMVVPITTSVMREVLLTVPRHDRDGALALGATRWEVIRGVVLPHSVGGLTGGVLLGLGRAMGETIAVALVIGSSARVTSNLFSSGDAMPAEIVNQWGEATGEFRSALVALGVVLFALTIVINVLARWVVGRAERRMQGA
jgi:phosphate transport system permease protein